MSAEGKQVVMKEMEGNNPTPTPVPAPAPSKRPAPVIHDPPPPDAVPEKSILKSSTPNTAPPASTTPGPSTPSAASPPPADSTTPGPSTPSAASMTPADSTTPGPSTPSAASTPQTPGTTPTTTLGLSSPVAPTRTLQWVSSQTPPPITTPPASTPPATSPTPAPAILREADRDPTLNPHIRKMSGSAIEPDSDTAQGLQEAEQVTRHNLPEDDPAHPLNQPQQQSQPSQPRPKWTPHDRAGFRNLVRAEHKSLRARLSRAKASCKKLYGKVKRKVGGS